MIYKGYKFRLYPTKEQADLIDKHFGALRFIYNLALQTKITAYSGTHHNLTRFDLQNEIPHLRKELPWLKDVSANVLSYAMLQLDTAYKNFFSGKSDFPRYKRKGGHQSYTIPSHAKIKDGLLSIPKLREGIKIIQHRPVVGEIRTATVSKTPTGKYFVSLYTRIDDSFPAKEVNTESTTIGIDLGIKKFAVCSNGSEIDSPQYLRSSLDRLKVLQRRAAKKKRGSSNAAKAYKKLTRLYEKVSNQRTDFLHKTSDSIIKNYDSICLENLNVAGMVKNHNLALSITDSSWSEFTRQLKYKSDWRGKNIIEINRFEPTTKKCSSCGKIKEVLLSERTYNCECGLSIDRDLNAAINIKNSGIGHAGVSVEPPTLVGAMKQKNVRVKAARK